jgi:hypothetical protein
VRKSPAYSHVLWNKYKAIMDSGQRTNNIIEGYNHSFSLSLSALATDWSIVERFKAEEAMTKAALHQAAMGNTGQKHNTSLYLKRQDCEVVSNFNNLSVYSYLESI